MTFPIARSVINVLGYDYAAAVEAFRQAKLEHRFTGDVAPSAPAIVEHAVRRVQVPDQADDFVTDYEVIEDVPVPTFADRQAELVGQVRALEAAALAKYLSPARERLMGLALGGVHMKPPEQRTEQDLQLIDFAGKHGEYKMRVQRHAAELEVAIEELTEATIDAWTPAPFPS
jgi:hypothetical protein